MVVPCPMFPLSPMVRRLSTLMTLALAACGSTAATQGSADDGWAAIAVQPRLSPAGGDGLTRRWTGADGQPVSVTVLAPRLAGHPTVTLSPVGGDNGPPILAALQRLRAAGGGTLRLAPGRYPIASGPPALPIDGLNDVLIDGSGAQLVFANWGDGIVVSDCARLAIRGVSVGYARPPVVMARVRGGALTFANGGPGAGASVYQVTGDGPGGPRVLMGKSGVPLGPGGRVGGPGLAGIADDTPVQVKLSYYNGGAIRIIDKGDRPLSHDITLDHVTVRDSAGVGVAAELMGRGLAVVGSQFGTPGGPSDIAYDALHITAMTGDILVEGNSFTGSGDDAINIASPIFDVAPGPGGRSAYISGSTAHVYPGARLAMFDANLQYLGMTQVSSRSPRDAQGRMPTAFATPVTGAIRYARNMDLLGQRYAIVGNQIADCVCHGVLAQNPDGLVRDNRFAGLHYNAIRLFTSAMWHEGAGAINVVVDDNRIDGTGADRRPGMVWAAITVSGELAANGAPQPPIATNPLNADLLIRDNQIANVDQGCVSVNSAVDVTLGNNGCTGFNRQPGATRMMVNRTGIAASLAQLPGKGAYLARGGGVWIDPNSTARVTRTGD